MLDCNCFWCSGESVGDIRLIRSAEENVKKSKYIVEEKGTDDALGNVRWFTVSMKAFVESSKFIRFLEDFIILSSNRKPKPKDLYKNKE